MSFKSQRKWFEKWVLKQFKGTPKKLLARNEMGYKDETINTMFISFCAGWQFRDLG